MPTDAVATALAASPPAEIRRTRMMLRWSSLTSLAGGLPWTFPAVVLLGSVTTPYVALPLAIWFSGIAIAGSVVWAHLVAGPDEVRIVPSEWMLAMGGIGGNFFLACLTFAFTAPLLGLGLATALATFVPLSPLGFLPLLQGVPVSSALLQSQTHAAWGQRLTVVAVGWLTLQMVLAFGLGATL